MRIGFRRVIEPCSFEPRYVVYINGTPSKVHMSPDLFRDLMFYRDLDPTTEMVDILWEEIHNVYGIKAACQMDSVRRQLRKEVIKIKLESGI